MDKLAYFPISVQLPLPVHLVPALRSVPLRVEYRLRLNTARPPWGRDKNNMGFDAADDACSEDLEDGSADRRRRRDSEKKVTKLALLCRPLALHVH
jgi:hypothetical protein